MHASSTPAEKAPTVLRPDTTDKARSQGPSGGSEKGAAPFDTVFQALSDRSDQSGTVRVATLPEPETATGAEAQARGDEDDMPGADDTAIARDPDPDALKNAETELDDTSDRPVEAANPSSPLDGSDVGSRPDQAARTPISAALVRGQVTPGRLDGPAAWTGHHTRSHAIGSADPGSGAACQPKARSYRCRGADNPDAVHAGRRGIAG